MKERILIIDDELPIRRLLEKMFCNEYDVITAGDAFEGLEVLKKNNISLIISDQRMPGMTGVELFEKTRFIYPQVIRILLSGYIEKSDLQHALENELIQHFVAKPWSVKELKTLVAEALGVKENMEIEENLPVN